MTLAVKNGLPVVESVQPHSPAYDIGIDKSDRLVAIWARLTGYMSLKEILDSLLDKPSLELKCTIEKTVSIPLKPYTLIPPSAKDRAGASFAMEFDGLTVASVREGGPAQDAGIKKGDLVTAIDGKPTRYMPLVDAINMISKSRESVVILTVRREMLIWRRD